jgi:putative ABC transport system permease protein
MLAMNLRFAVRMLRKNPVFTLVAAITLALGIGANTAIFSVVYAALLRPLPYRQPERLVTLGQARKQLADSPNTSYPDFLEWSKSAKSFESLTAYSSTAFVMSSAGSEPKIIFGGQAPTNFFRTLGVKPALGRDFSADEAGPDGPHVAIVSDSLWRSEFGADPSVIGRTIRLDDKSVTVVGVLPANFEFAPRFAPVWTPMSPTGDLATRRSLRWTNVIGRLAPGVSEEQARAEMNGITARLAQAYPKEDAAVILVMGKLRDQIVGKIRPLLFVLAGTVGFVLLITCANVANLLMTRSVGRRKEFAVRSALGATRRDLLGQLLTESILLSAIGAGVGLLAARWGVDLLIALIPDGQLNAMPFLRSAGINPAVLLFLAGVTVLTAILFGIAPGLAASKWSLNDALKDEARGGTSGSQTRLRNALVVVEIAMSLVLLAGAGLMLESLRALLHQNPGFDLTHVLAFSVALPRSSYPSDKTYPFDSPGAVRFEHAFTDRLRNLPGVQSVGTSTAPPASGGGGSIRFVEQGRPTATGQDDECDILTVNDGYFSALKVPLTAGRVFNEHDTTDAPPVIVVNRIFARTYFPNQDAVGQRVRFTFNVKEPYRQIVGVVGDTAEDDLAAPPAPVIYYPNDQGASTYLFYLVRTTGDPAAFIGTARAALRDTDPQLPMIRPTTLEQIAAQSPSVFLRRYPSYLIGAFAGLALMLAMVGLYGLISYAIAQRTREIGIRMTLGAQRADILRLVLREGFGAVLAGTGLGVIAGVALTRLLSSLLFGVKPGDVSTFAAVAALLIAVALLASWIPARRAMRVDPMYALRHE